MPNGSILSKWGQWLHTALTPPSHRPHTFWSGRPQPRKSAGEIRLHDPSVQSSVRWCRGLSPPLKELVASAPYPRPHRIYMEIDIYADADVTVGREVGHGHGVAYMGPFGQHPSLCKSASCQTRRPSRRKRRSSARGCAWACSPLIQNFAARAHPPHLPREITGHPVDPVAWGISQCESASSQYQRQSPGGPWGRWQLMPPASSWQLRELPPGCAGAIV